MAYNHSTWPNQVNQTRAPQMMNTFPNSPQQPQLLPQQISGQPLQQMSNQLQMPMQMRQQQHTHQNIQGQPQMNAVMNQQIPSGNFQTGMLPQQGQIMPGQNIPRRASMGPAMGMPPQGSATLQTNQSVHPQAHSHAQPPPHTHHPPSTPGMSPRGPIQQPQQQQPLQSPLMPPQPQAQLPPQQVILTSPPPNVRSAPQMHSNTTLPTERHVVSREKLQELVQQIDHTERLDAEAEDLLMLVADDFVESVTEFACKLAKHRKSTTLEASDLELHLEKAWNIKIPGFSSTLNPDGSAKPRRQSATGGSTAATSGGPHQQRMSAIKRTRKS